MPLLDNILLTDNRGRRFLGEGGLGTQAESAYLSVMTIDGSKQHFMLDQPAAAALTSHHLGAYGATARRQTIKKLLSGGKQQEHCPYTLPPGISESYRQYIAHRHGQGSGTSKNKQHKAGKGSAFPGLTPGAMTECNDSGGPLRGRFDDDACVWGDLHPQAQLNWADVSEDDEEE